MITYLNIIPKPLIEMKIRNAIDVLLNHNKPTRRVIRDRANFGKVMELFGNPYKDFRSIHITGTNGKGSVSLKIAKILELAGYKVGLYTSPHLFSFRERIKVNGQLCHQDTISDIILSINDMTVKHNIPLSYFQILTAASFLYFREQKCDFASIEVGIGGLKDTTNVVTPLVSVLTSIGMDHMDLLGPTLDDIARDKSGIIKEGIPVVLGPTAQRQVIRQIANKKSSPIFAIDEKKPYESFNSKNNAITSQVIRILQNQYGILVSAKNLEEGLKAKQPCRMELLPKQYLPQWAQGKQIYFDVGHNPDAIKQIVKFFNSVNKQVTVVYGTSKGKNYGEILQLYETIAKQIYLVQADHSRAASITEIQASFITYSSRSGIYKVISDGNIKKTLIQLTTDSSTNIILVCGSFFMMPQARGFFQPQLLQQKQQCLNQCYQLLN